MDRLSEILTEFKDIATDPRGAVKRHRDATGKGAIGILPIYAPEEIVHASGFLPIGIWGGQVSVQKSRTYMATFTCPIMQSISELSLNGVYDELDAVLISAICDTLKVVQQTWKGKCTVISFSHPQNRKAIYAQSFLASEYEGVRRQLQEILRSEITDASINNSIYVYNRYRAAMRHFTTVATNYPKSITPVVRHHVIKAGLFAEKKLYTEKIESLTRKLESLPSEQHTGKKVILTGISAEPAALLEILGDFNLAIVGDDLAQESRQFRTDVPIEGGTPIQRLAAAWQNQEGCSLAFDTEKKRMTMLVELARQTGADGIIACMMKFCDPEEFDYPIMREMMRRENIPLLSIDIDQQAMSFEQNRTRIQGFAEII